MRPSFKIIDFQTSNRRIDDDGNVEQHDKHCSDYAEGYHEFFNQSFVHLGFILRIKSIGLLSARDDVAVFCSDGIIGNESVTH